MSSLYAKIHNPKNLYRKTKHQRKKSSDSSQVITSPVIKIKKTSEQREKKNPFIHKWRPFSSGKWNHFLDMFSVGDNPALRDKRNEISHKVS